MLYDGRGSGPSALESADFSLPSMLRDLDAVVQEAGLSLVNKS